MSLQHQLPAKPNASLPAVEDDRLGGGRGKFNRERDESSGYARKDSFGRDSREPLDRKRRDRSDSRDDDRRKRRRSMSPRSRGGGGAGDGNKYVPNYDRDGYIPPPRYNGGAGGMAPVHGNGRMNKIDDPIDLDYQMSFRQFIEFSKFKHRESRARGELDDEEIRRRFQTYKDKYQVKILTAFFDEHKGSEWFREKYHPIDSLPLREEVHKRQKSFFPNFLDDIRAGKLDEISFDEIPSSTPATDAVEDAKPADIMDADDAEVPKEDEGTAPAGAAASTLSQMPTANPAVSHFKISALFLKAVPPTVKRQQLIEICKKVEGFSYLVISDPRPDKKFYRLGWIVFDEGADLEKAREELNLKKIDDFTLNLAPHNNMTIRSRLLPAEFNSPERLERDLENARRLIEGGAIEAIESRLQDIVFKQEAYQEPHKEDDRMEDDEEHAALDRAVDGPTPVSTKKTKLTLDILIEYLRRVHWYDFYSGVEADGPEDFCRRAWVHIRKAFSGAEIEKDATNSRPSHKKSDYQHFSERLDSRVALRTLVLSPGSWGGEELEKLHVAKIESEKYRCKDCSKLFRGEEFVRKHIRSKHPEVVKELMVDVDFYNAYVRDPNRAHYAYGMPSATGGVGGASGGIPNFGGKSTVSVPTVWPPPMPPIMMAGGPLVMGATEWVPGGDVSSRLGPPAPRGGRGAGGGGPPPSRNMPVDPRSRNRIGENIELDYD
ncbi:hypothetical protein BC829DRAFT_406320 [Chytridium lagenaria]|nr:hypothetical protein BC829DRAFT_406320 [Chytridium lagenaria]